MTTVSKTFAAAGEVSDTLAVPPNRSMAFAITGTFVATLVLEHTFNNGATWITDASYTATQSSTPFQAQALQGNTVYRVRCSAYTSGSPAITMADVVGIIERIVNPGQIAALTVQDDGIVAPSETIPIENIVQQIVSGLVFWTGIETSLTAHAGGTQAAALALSSSLTVHNVTTVATAADSVKLPAATAGAIHIVINSAAANAMQVFGQATETINGVASATGVSQPAGQAVIYVCAVAGQWRTSGVLNGMSLPTLTVTLLTATSALITDETVQNLAVAQLFSLEGIETGLTAHAGGGQGSALALSSTKVQHNVTVVATAADSVKLPASAAGRVHIVVNSAALPMQVFGAGTDTINGIATATGITQLAGTTAIYICAVAGNWLRLGSVHTQGVVALADATVAADCARGNTFSILQAANNTLAAPINPVDGMVITYVITQNAGGNTLAYDAIFSFSTSNPSPTLSVAAAARDNIAFKYCAAANKWDCVGIDLGH